MEKTLGQIAAEAIAAGKLAEAAATVDEAEAHQRKIALAVERAKNFVSEAKERISGAIMSNRKIPAIKVLPSLRVYSPKRDDVGVRVGGDMLFPHASEQYAELVRWGAENDLDITLQNQHDGVGMEDWYVVHTVPTVLLNKKRDAYFAALKGHDVNGKNANPTIFVKLLKSDNKVIQYPALGLLEIHEKTSDALINVATFRQLNKDGTLGAKVGASRPVFEFDSAILTEGLK